MNRRHRRVEASEAEGARLRRRFVHPTMRCLTDPPRICLSPCSCRLRREPEHIETDRDSASREEA